MRLLKPDDPLPVKLTLRGNLNVTIDYTKEEDYPTAFKMMEEMKEDTLSEDDVKDFEGVKQYLNSVTTYMMKIEETGEALAFMACQPSQISRSVNPKVNSGIVIIHKDYRSTGTGGDILYLYVSLCFQTGYHGYNGRATILNSGTLMACAKGGALLMGVLPRSMKHHRAGWVDDILIYDDYQATFRAVLGQEMKMKNPTRRKPSIVFPAQLRDIPLEKRLQANQQFKFPTQQHTFQDGTKATLSIANAQEEQAVESMIWRAAQRGEGFGLDEFTKKGGYAARFLRKPIALVAKASVCGSILGAALLGSTILTRSSASGVLGGYVITDEDHMGRGFGKQIGQIVIDKAKENGYFGVASDAFSTESKAQALMRSLGLRGSCTIPMCSDLHGKGTVDSTVYYRRLGASIEAERVDKAKKEDRM